MQVPRDASRVLAPVECVKRRENTHSRSTCSVVPASYILGTAALAPVAVQKVRFPRWSREKDDQERLWWTLPWTMRWGDGQDVQDIRGGA